MTISKKLYRRQTEDPTMPKFTPSRWRSLNEFDDDEMHNDEIHGVKDGNQQSRLTKGTTAGA